MEQYISATKNQRQQLMKIFKCTDRMLREALSNRSNSDLAKKIRIASIKMGCQTYVVANEMECWHDVDGVMYQLFHNGAQLELHKETGKAYLYHKGILVGEYDEIGVREISNLQSRAKAL